MVQLIISSKKLYILQLRFQFDRENKICRALKTYNIFCTQTCQVRILLSHLLGIYFLIIASPPLFVTRASCCDNPIWHSNPPTIRGRGSNWNIHLDNGNPTPGPGSQTTSPHLCVTVLLWRKIFFSEVLLIFVFVLEHKDFLL